MKLTVLMENSPNPENSNLKYGHGLSIYAETDNKKILYDFGLRGKVSVNSSILGIDLKSVDTAVLSHGHYDHSGDLKYFLEINSKASLYFGRNASVPRWSISKGSPRDIGIPSDTPELTGERFIEVDNLVDLEDLVLLPAAPGVYPKPSGNSLLLCGLENDRIQDDFSDEVTAVLRGKKGLVVLTGCSHRGILNIVEQVRTYCFSCPVQALIGGFHLRDSEEKEESIRETAIKMKEMIPGAEIYTGHCTESNAGKVFKEIFGSRYNKLFTGQIIKPD